MKGIPGRVTKALPSQAKLECADNTGAKDKTNFELKFGFNKLKTSGLLCISIISKFLFFVFFMKLLQYSFVVLVNLAPKLLILIFT